MHDLKAEAKRQIQNRIDFYETVRLAKTESKYFEADVETKFIDPFLKALGWDPSSNEVKKRFKIGRKVVDYALQIGSVGREPNILVEVKSLVQDLDGKELDEDIQDYITYPKKVVGYAWRSRVNWAILTNFKELRVYNVGWSKIPEKALWFSATYDKFLDDKTFERIWAISREGVVTGILDTYDTRTKRKPVDRQFLEDLVKCRLLLIDNIRRRNKGLKPELLKECTQRILDRLVIMRAAEDLRVEKADLLRREIVKEKGGWDKLKQWLFRNFDKRFNSRIFAKHPCDDLEIDNEVIQTVVDILYNGTGESSGYRFDEIHADMLGSMYEDYIGYILKEEGEIYRLEKKMEKRKAKGIYYTPTYVVEYIVENTLGTLLKGMSPPEVKNIHILDPACGSGSFLTKAQDVLKRYYESTMEQLKKKEGEKIDLYISKDYASLSKDILTENIYGVDLDSQAAEIASVNLSLKILADMKEEMKLPEVMGENIKVGNSLISNHRQDLEKYFKHPTEKKPFNWDEEFSHVFEQGGFDVVIGNPPYGAELDSEDRDYISEKYKYSKSYKNTALIFIERSLELLKDGGYLGFIVPKSLAFSQLWKAGRELIKNDLDAIVDVSKAFKEVLLEQVIIILKKGNEKNKYQIENIDLPGEKNLVERRYIDVTDSLIVHSSMDDFEIFKKMNDKYIYLNDISKTSRGLPFQKYATRTKSDYKVYRGDNISRYTLKENPVYVGKDKINEKSEKVKFLKQPKIVSQRIVAHVMKPKDHIIIMSTLDKKGILTLDTVENTIITDNKFSLEFILCLLNSKLISWYAYRYIFAKAIRTMDFDNYYIGKIPIPKKEISQETFIKLADKMLSLNKQLNEIDTDFERYLTEPVVSDVSFRDFYDKLDISEKEALDRKSRGNIRKLKVEEQGDWLVFKVDYVARKKGDKQEFKDGEIVKCKFKEKPLRKFLFYTINNYKEPLGTGNLLLKILRIPVPCFDKDPKKNGLIITKMMQEYLKVVREKERLEKEIQETDDLINRKVYELYGLNEGEIKIIEESLQ